MQTTAYQEAKKLNTGVAQREVLRVLKGWRPNDGWITDEEIALEMDPASNERAVRIIIRDLRLAGQPIASESGRGYKWAKDDPDAMLATIAEINSRIGKLSQLGTALEKSYYASTGGKKATKQIEAGQMQLV